MSFSLVHGCVSTKWCSDFACFCASNKSYKNIELCKNAVYDYGLIVHSPAWLSEKSYANLLPNDHFMVMYFMLMISVYLHSKLYLSMLLLTLRRRGHVNNIPTTQKYPGEMVWCHWLGMLGNPKILHSGILILSTQQHSQIYLLFFSSDDSERGKRCTRAKCKSCCKSFTAFLFSTVGLVILVCAYSAAGGFLFQMIEASHEKQGIVDGRDFVYNVTEKHIIELWNVTRRFNILYEENWTMAAREVMLAYQVGSHLPMFTLI